MLKISPFACVLILTACQPIAEMCNTEHALLNQENQILKRENEKQAERIRELEKLMLENSRKQDDGFSVMKLFDK